MRRKEIEIEVKMKIDKKGGLTDEVNYGKREMRRLTLIRKEPL